jgi:hypothetical protein
MGTPPSRTRTAAAAALVRGGATCYEPVMLMNESSAKSRTLILVHHPDRQQRQDFDEIKAKVETLAPHIDVHVAEAGGSADQLDDHIWQRPCLIVSFGPLRFRPKRGLIYCCRPIPKFRQVQNLHRAGVPVPLTAQLRFGQPLDKGVWGPLVVLKPTTPGFMSHGSVFLMRTEKVVELAEVAFPAGHPSRRLPVLVQRFVDTGERPCYNRVLTLFGEALYCRKGYTANPRPPLDASDDVLLNAKIATNALFGERHADNDPDVLNLARRAYAAMPAIPLQGVDIIREQATGRLFVLEVNPGGNTWHFSSRHTQHFQDNPHATSRAERIAQFGAWGVAARALIRKTMEKAR